MSYHLRAALTLDERAARVPFDPQIASATAQVFSTAATSVTVTRPAVNVGDRLVVMLTRSSADSDPIAPPAGVTALDSSALTGTASSFTRAYYQDVTAANVADASIAFTGGTSTESVSLVWRLTGCDLTVAPVATGTLQNSNGVTTVNPGAASGPNGGASQRNIFLTYVGTATQDSLSGATPAVTVFPTGYTGTGTSTTTDAGAIANGCGQGWGSKIATAGSDDPSAWTYCPTPPGCRALAVTVVNRGVQE